MNRHDLKAFLSAWHEDSVFINPGDIPESGTFQGKTAVEGWFRRFYKQYPTIRFDVQSIRVANIFDLLDNNEVAVHMNVQLANQAGRVSENNCVTMVSLKGGKAVKAKDFLFDLGDNIRLSWSAM